eukprot:snap_masked-scaffold_4-processed-gene-20.8-mRNA-1 protein AED:0.12 eAED:1.00 QI:0/-1/0/1/-1/1/1/0/337
METTVEELFGSSAYVANKIVYISYEQNNLDLTSSAYVANKIEYISDEENNLDLTSSPSIYLAKNVNGLVLNVPSKQFSSDNLRSLETLLRLAKIREIGLKYMNLQDATKIKLLSILSTVTSRITVLSFSGGNVFSNRKETKQMEPLLGLNGIEQLQFVALDLCKEFHKSFRVETFTEATRLSVRECSTTMFLFHEIDLLPALSNLTDLSLSFTANTIVDTNSLFTLSKSRVVRDLKVFKLSLSPATPDSLLSYNGFVMYSYCSLVSNMHNPTSLFLGYFSLDYVQEASSVLTELIGLNDSLKDGSFMIKPKRMAAITAFAQKAKICKKFAKGKLDLG